jgi:Ca2+-binding RTX toxin-like protein
MASIPGSQYDVYAGGQTINFGITTDPNNVPPANLNDYNLEVVVNATGTDQGYSMASGYEALVVMSNDGHTISLVHGDFGLDDGGTNDTIYLGDGAESVGGGSGDTIHGGTGSSQFIDASKGNQTVFGGTGGSETIWGGANTSITGGSGGDETIAGASGTTIQGGSGGNEFIDGSKGGQSITGGAGNETIWGGFGDTITGGSGNETIGGGYGDTITGGSGNEFIDGHLVLLSQKVARFGMLG